MSWSTGKVEPAPKPLSPEAQLALGKYGSEDGLLMAWSQAKENLDAAKELEAALRSVVFEVKFPNPEEGTQRAPIGTNGWNIKAAYPYNYDLDKDRTEAVQQAIASLSPKADVIAERLIKWEPILSIKEYRLLVADDTPEGASMRMMLSGVLTVKPGMPQLTLEPPKKKA